MEQAVELADFIWQLRSELSRAMWGGEDKDLRFRAETVELELTFGVEKSRDPGARVTFWVFDAGLAARQNTAWTQTIRLVLHPVRADLPEEPALLSGDSFDHEE